MLNLLKQEASLLNQVVVNVIPSRDIGVFFGNFFHREQSLGEIRGLERLQALITSRKLELEQLINPPKDRDPEEV